MRWKGFRNGCFKVLFKKEGFTLFMVLASIVISGIFLSMGVKQWKVIVKRDKEAELLFRGEQIRRAIVAYFNKPGAKKYPSSLNDLVSDGFNRKGYLRRLYIDPMTNKDFEVLGFNNGIVGVRSTSTDVPLKTGNFHTGFECFENARTYQDWVFVFVQKKNVGKPNPKVKSAQGKKIVPSPSQFSPCEAIIQLKVINKED